jgi:hypothetical protein
MGFGVSNGLKLALLGIVRFGVGGGDYFTGYGRNLISNWIFSMKAKTKC